MSGGLCDRESTAALKVSGRLFDRESTAAQVASSTTERRDRDRLFDREAWPRLGLGEWSTPFNKSDDSGYLETAQVC